MLEIPKVISQEDLIEIAETINCENLDEFKNKLAIKAALDNLSKDRRIKIINIEKTIGEKTNFQYIAYKEGKFYFVRINSEKMPHKKKILLEKSKLEKRLGINFEEIILYNPISLSSKRTLKKIKNIEHKLINLEFDSRDLELLKKEQSENRIANFKAQLKYSPQTREFYLNPEEERQESINYCLGKNISRKEKRKNCKEGLIENLKNPCKKCRNYLKLTLEPKVRTQNEYNRQAIKYLESIKRIKQEEELQDFKPANTELSKLAQKLL